LAPIEVELREVDGAVVVVGGWCSSRNLTLPAVAKQEM
jgi:hypothetical protein